MFKQMSLGGTFYIQNTTGDLYLRAHFFQEGNNRACGCSSDLGDNTIKAALVAMETKSPWIKFTVQCFGNSPVSSCWHQDLAIKKSQKGRGQ